MSMTIIKGCSCQHEFQDKTYGKGNRVHNIGVNGQQTCTVCGTKKGK